MSARHARGRSVCEWEQLESRQLLSGDALATQTAGGVADPAAAQPVPVLTAVSADGDVYLNWTGSQSTPWYPVPEGFYYFPGWTPAKSHVEQQNSDGSYTQIQYVDQLPMYSGIEGTAVGGLSLARPTPSASESKTART